MRLGLGERRTWSDLSGVERVGLYTRQSLYILLAGYSVFAVLTAAGKIDNHGQALALAAGAVVVDALAIAAMIGLLRGFPALRPLPARSIAALLAASVLFVAAAAAFWESPARGAAATIVVVAITLSVGLLPGRRLAAVLLVLSTALLAAHSGSVGGAVAGLVLCAAFLFTGRVSIWLLGIVTELDQARHAQTELAVLEERLRFSRDVHDVLGRRLSTIAVQSELAATLASRGDERASERMLDVRAVAHEALREARELARGYRSTDLPKELEGARSLLRSAGIEVAVHVGDVPRAWHEAAGWVVRESVTNVLRHSSATRVEITYGEGALSVSNDGVPDTEPAHDGAGLRGLHERLEPLGASLRSESNGARWIVTARLPDAGPLSAARGES